MRIQFFFILSISLFFSCKREAENKVPEEKSSEKIVTAPPFNADSAYLFIKKQVDFGPRVPNTKAHLNTGDYLVETLENYGATVSIQTFESVTYDGHRLRLRNIIGSFFPQHQKRILLAAHWDTRPFADKDKDKPDAPFDGANDGASGVGVLLEIARVFHTYADPEVGVDVIFFDGEDWGEKIHEKNPAEPPEGLDGWWCLGSQYWSKNKHKPNYSAYYGILLDMVGGKNATFFREEYSLTYAPLIVDKVWNAAEKLGYSHIFVKKNQGAITDDHVYVNQYAKIPMIDIIPFDQSTGQFGSFHHTTEDSMDVISKETLQAVGSTLLYVLYSEEGINL